MRPDLIRPPPRVIGRLCFDFILRAVRDVVRHLDGDILGGLVVLALLQRDSSQVIGDTAIAAPSPARPVSVKSLARSLKAPAETMRRAVGRLLAQDWCARVAHEGITISRSATAHAKIESLMADIRANFWAFLSDLKHLGFDFDLMDRMTETGDLAIDVVVPPQEGAPSFVQEPPAQRYDRAILNFGLRVVDCGTTPFGNDYAMTCVFAAIMSANASPFAYDANETWNYRDHQSPPPDSARRPASLTEISQILGLPYETARRYVNTLIARGHCVRDEKKGLLIPMDLLQSPPAFQTGTAIVGRFVQMIGELKHLGFDFRAIPSAQTEFNRRSQ